ncbi:MAG: choice-of-anchor D domain-containing protein [Gammaproteobacteria bacterium]|nr:choice-of-anchor D domain-containing protein [Gammaproteobacteria bacterium]
MFGLLAPGHAAAQSTPLSDLDALRYIASYPDLIEAFGADPAKGRSHYETLGTREGRKITFEPLPYIASHPDLMRAFGANALDGARHYINFGFREGRKTTFDPLRYAASYPDLVAAFGADANRAATHYIQYGYKEGRQTTFTEADVLRYIASYTDLIRAFGTDVVAGIRHYLTWGFNEGRRILFDALAYIASYGDLIAAFGADLAAGARHYIQWGLQEGRTISFDPSVYAALNSDIRSAFQTDTQRAAQHFITNGVGEARPVSSTPQLSRSAITFSATGVGQISASETITVVNNGSSVLTFSRVVRDGRDSDQFRHSTDCVRSLAPSASCSISVEFRPTRSGNRAAVLYLQRGSTTATTDPKISLLGAADSALSGETAGTAARTATDLLAARPGIESGLYWFDPDGGGGNPPFLTYADMTTAGGGWMQVRRIAGVGGWYPFDDNLRGTTPSNPQFSAEINAATHWSLKFDYFVDSGTEYLFSSGDGTVWCVLRRGTRDFDGGTTLAARNSTVLYSSGTTLAEGAKTNVLQRGVFLEDPWIGCEGDHTANTQRMLYGEAGIGDHRALKNTRGGINVFVRPAQFHPRLRPLVVDIDAVKNATTDASGLVYAEGASAIRVYLPAGEYEIAPTGPAQGSGAFTAIELCTCNTNPRKFVHLYDYVTSESPTRVRVQKTTTFDWTDAGRALSDATTTKVKLSKAGWVQFFIFDTSIADNAGGVSLLIREAGFGLLETSTSSLSFSSVGETQRVTIRNTGNDVLNISGISLTGTQSTLFSQFNDCPKTLTSQGSCRVDIKWVQVSGTLATATLRIESDSRTGTALVVISAALPIPPSPDLDFGNQKVGAASPTKSLVVRGPASIGFIRAEELTTTVEPTGDTVGLSTDFRVTSHNCPICEGPASACSNPDRQLPSGASCTINVEFRPLSTGVKNARLSLRGPRGLTSGAVGAVGLSYSLSGTGVP